MKGNFTKISSWLLLSMLVVAPCIGGKDELDGKIRSAMVTKEKRSWVAGFSDWQKRLLVPVVCVFGYFLFKRSGKNAVGPKKGYSLEDLSGTGAPLSKTSLLVPVEREQEFFAQLAAFYATRREDITQQALQNFGKLKDFSRCWFSGNFSREQEDCMRQAGGIVLNLIDEFIKNRYSASGNWGVRAYEFLQCINNSLFNDEKNVERVIALLRAGLTLDPVLSDGTTIPSHIATLIRNKYSNHYDWYSLCITDKLLQALLERSGAEIALVGFDRNSSILGNAIEQGHRKMVEIILFRLKEENKKLGGLKDLRGNCYLALVCKSLLSNFLSEDGSYKNNYFGTDKVTAWLVIMERLLDAGDDPNADVYYLQSATLSPLECLRMCYAIAASGGSANFSVLEKVVKKLVEKGAVLPNSEERMEFNTLDVMMDHKGMVRWIPRSH